MTTVLLNITDFNNDWNKSVLEMSRRERSLSRGFVKDEHKKPVIAVQTHDDSKSKPQGVQAQKQ